MLNSISTELDEDRRLAYQRGQAGAAVSATTQKAKLHGLMKDPPDVSVAITKIVRVIVDPELASESRTLLDAKPIDAE